MFMFFQQRPLADGVSINTKYVIQIWVWKFNTAVLKAHLYQQP